MKKTLSFIGILALIIMINFVSSTAYPASSMGISSVPSEVQTLASGSDIIYPLEDSPLQKEIKKCNKSEGCYLKGDCFLTGDIINSNYCFGGKFMAQKSWGNLCEKDFECIENFCLEGKCYRGGRDSYLENKNKELEDKLNNLEETINQKENLTNTNSITGNVVNDPVEKQNWIIKIWRNIFRK